MALTNYIKGLYLSSKKYGTVNLYLSTEPFGSMYHMPSVAYGGSSLRYRAESSLMALLRQKWEIKWSLLCIR